MDIVRKKYNREITLLLLVGLMAIVANLPVTYLASYGVERSLIMAVLGLLVILALFLYLRFFFFLLYTLLAVGANLPDQWADGLGISRGPLLFTLVSMVILSLLNYGVKILPSGLEPKPRKRNPEATQVLLNAIERGNLTYIKTVLSMNIDLDQAGDQGLTPLMVAALRGDMRVVEMLLTRGASASLSGPQGTSAEIALRNSFPTVSERLKHAEEKEAAKRNAPSPDQAPSVQLG